MKGGRLIFTNSNRGKSLGIKTILIIGCSAFILICIEIVFVISNISTFNPVYQAGAGGGIYQLDEELIYSLKPNAELIWAYGEFAVEVKINSFGLRDSEIKDRNLYEKRIIITGDSMTFGHGVNNEETFPNQLENIFREHHQSVEVINAGISGYGTDQAYKLFTTRLLSLKPSMLIFAIFTNDLPDNINLPLYTIEANALAPIDPTKNWLYALGQVDQVMPGIIRKRRIYRFVINRLTNKDLFSVLPDLNSEGLHRWSQQKILLQIARLQDLGRINGFELMVLCIPSKWGNTGYYKWIQQDGIRILNLHQDSIWRKEKESLFFTHDFHLTKKGHKLIAKRLYDSIRTYEFTKKPD